MLRTTGNEYPDFIAAVSMLFGLAPDDARAQLEQRAERLAAELAETEAQLRRATPTCRGSSCSRRSTGGRCSQAELAWVRGVIADLDDRAPDLERGVAPGDRRRASTH